MNIVIMGPSGSGKSTQAKLVAEKLGIIHLSPGKIMREIYEAGLEDGLEANRYTSEGKLVPAVLLHKIIKDWLKKQGDIKGIVTDGFPRTIEDVNAIDEGILLGDKQFQVVFVNVSDEVCVERLRERAEIEKRADETEWAIKQRLSWYQEQTKPLLDIYSDRGVLVEVDGNGTIEEIHKEIMNAIASFHQNSKM